MPTVSIVLFRMFHYRIDFLNQLRAKLATEAIELIVYYGKPTKQSLQRKDSQTLEWGKEIPTRTITIGGKEIMLQLPPMAILNSSLIVCMQENRLLVNYALQLTTMFNRNSKFAFFGHGKNFQSKSSNGVREKFKKMIVKRSDWFFAYTALSKNVLLDSDYPEECISVVNNTIDTKLFATEISSKSDVEKKRFKEKLGIPDDAVVGLFCGSIYKMKLPQFVIDSCIKIKKEHANFHLIVLGAGPDAHVFEEASKIYSWIHYRGMQKGEEKTLAYSIAEIIVNPGLVGLHIVDSFSAGVPMVTSRVPYHSPEYQYLEDGINGIVTENNVNEYSKGVIEILHDRNKIKIISNNALSSAETYSLEKMVESFVTGIKSAIDK